MCVFILYAIINANTTQCCALSTTNVCIWMLLNIIWRWCRHTFSEFCLQGYCLNWGWLDLKTWVYPSQIGDVCMASAICSYRSQPACGTLPESCFGNCVNEANSFGIHECNDCATNLLISIALNGYLYDAVVRQRSSLRVNGNMLGKVLAVAQGFKR
jgi:hypothetical protein